MGHPLEEAKIDFQTNELIDQAHNAGPLNGREIRTRQREQ
jgi:hypothetical protein